LIFVLKKMLSLLHYINNSDFLGDIVIFSYEERHINCL